MKGYIQVYTGDGKGKTTAAIGLAMRAAGTGMKVLFAQFMKDTEYGEIKSMRKFAGIITVKQYGRGNFIADKPSEEDVMFAVKGIEEVKRLMTSGEYDLVILDEANIAVHFNLFSARDLLDVMDARPDNVELIITGRRADSKVIERADLVTEMVEIKHYYHKGVQSRPGIEK